LNNLALVTAVSILQNSKIGLVHHIPVAVHISTLGGFLDAVYLNSLHARMYNAINQVGIMSMVIGKSNLFRKKDMEHVGGLLQYAKYMSEDNEIGKSIMNLGKKTSNCSRICLSING
jgi:ceramide glucosyltransferase